MIPGRMVVAACMALSVAACAVRLGGPGPLDRDALALKVASDATAEQTAQLLTQHGTEYAILSAARDSAWFAAVAARSGLTSTRPGSARGTTYAFLGPKALGDTTLTLKVPGGGELRVHDALFELDKNRRLDLLVVQLDTLASLQRSIETLMLYVASDVGATVAVLLAVEPPTPALGDSVAVIMRALYADVWECTSAGRGGARAPALPIRLFYGPAVRIRCAGAETVGTGGLLGHFQLR
ncbi:MAG: hypothetical protein ACT4O1_04730 [Gemmatimonadota bacterium]